jgi:capsular polysaccharide biosynthesis protein
VLPKLIQLEEAGIEECTPILISPELVATRFFQEALSRRRHQRRYNFVPLDGTSWHRTDSLLFGSRAIHCSDDGKAVRDWLNIPTAAVTNRRVFITRPPRRGRHLANFDQLVPLFRRHGFEVVDTEGWSLHQQVRLMAETSHLAGVHGAGLANMILGSNPDLKVLEIMPFTGAGLDTVYEPLARSMGYQYVRLVGRATAAPSHHSRNLPFQVDVADCEAALARFVG